MVIFGCGEMVAKKSRLVSPRLPMLRIEQDFVTFVKSEKDTVCDLVNKQDPVNRALMSIIELIKKRTGVVLTTFKLQEMARDGYFKMTVGNNLGLDYKREIPILLASVGENLVRHDIPINLRIDKSTYRYSFYELFINRRTVVSFAEADLHRLVSRSKLRVTSDVSLVGYNKTTGGDGGGFSASR